MVESHKQVIASALKLPRKVRMQLAEQLIESLDDPEIGEALFAGARLAQQRIQACRTGKMKIVEEEEIMTMLESKPSS
jgi:mRNA-degrading endonuclease RelE of RelBE toxin-antitoxin system